jgi:hypothetical protein
MRTVGINTLCTGPGCVQSPGSDASHEAAVSIFTNHEPALSGVGFLLRSSVLCREGSLVTELLSQITAFLIVTPAIRNTFNSFSCSKSVHSNRHSPPTLLSANFAGVTF